MDIIIFQKINGLVGINSLLDEIVWFLASPLAYTLAGLLLLALIWPKFFGLENRLPVILALASALIARFLVKNLIVLFYNRPRPFDILEVNQVIEHSSLGSFPSGHAIFFFTLATVLILYNKKTGVLFFIGAILIGFGRLAAGLHWPSDIMTGASLGILTGVLAFIISKNYLSNRSKQQIR